MTKKKISSKGWKLMDVSSFFPNKYFPKWSSGRLERYFDNFVETFLLKFEKNFTQNPKKVANKITHSKNFSQKTFWSGKRQLRKLCRKIFSLQVRKKLNVKSLYSKMFSCKMNFWQIQWFFDKLVKKFLPEAQNFVSPNQGKLLPSIFYPKQVQLKCVSDQ